MLNFSKSITRSAMAKGYVTKDILNAMISLIISAGVVVATVSMMFLIFIAAILLIGIVLS